ncbi:MAG: DUF1553 domain-containing protein [Verrucomicrobia bacterium]|nr:DUF1553 domain-containing protein [Verrucomicrobiota bacterium]
MKWAFRLLLPLTCGSLWAATPATDRVDFNFEVRPILSDRCFFCHGPDEKGRKAKLRLDQKEGLFEPRKDGAVILKPGDPAGSELLRRILTADPDDVMPPPDSHLDLSPAEKDLLRRWIEQGAEWRDHWAFNPIQLPTPPAVPPTAKVVNPIDQFVVAKLEAAGLRQSPPADPGRLLRRISLDLVGLPPSPEELKAFESSQDPRAYEEAVDRLLASPAYGERMANEWLDVARFADTYGYQADVERDLSPWRDWVIRSFNDNLPYDQFITWQLAGDLLPNATDEQILATAFNRLHRQTNEGGSIDEEFRQEYVSDRVHTMGTAFLGLTLECSRCHDHKYDPISQRDYYALAAFFNNIDESGLYSHFTSATPTPTLLRWEGDGKARHAELVRQIAGAEQQLKSVATEGQARLAKAAPATLSAPAPIAHYAFDSITNNRTADNLSTNAASLSDNPELVAGRLGQALRFSGDNSVTIPVAGQFKRTDPFSLSLWLKPTERQDRAVVLHYSRAWSDSGSRGYELVLDHGRPFFGLIHFWPGNALAIRAKDALPTNAWSQITVTYDGSSRAAGVQLYRDGVPLETEVVRDRLTRDIQHRAEWGDSEAGSIRLTLAGRFRDNGFRNGELDELQIFNTALTPAEVRVLNGLPAGATSDLLATRVVREDAAYAQALAELKRLRDAENDLVNATREIMVMQEMPGRRPTFVLKRGAYDSPGDPVDANAPERILPFAQEWPRNRLGFAKWVTDPRNPLTARVAVNRIWKQHFGRGLVNTLNDFGAQGQLPANPALLDWLAGHFIESGWNVKALHKLIVLSATYRQASEASPELVARDPENRLLARGPKHRLSAEQIRDQALAASGLLTVKVGGPSVKPYQPAGVWEEAGTGKTYTQDHGDKLYRRSLYTFWRRTAPPPSMLSFDAVTREVCTANREVTATPLQSLVLMNDPQFIEAARVLAENLWKSSANALSDRLNQGFLTVTGRPPLEREQEILRQLYAEQLDYFTRQPDAAQKLLKTGERPADSSLPAPEIAAATMVVSTLMNHDEFVMKR